MIYGYARVSTKGQALDGNSLEAQEAKLREHGAEVVYKDSYTGTKLHRPELDKLMQLLQEGDVLMVTKLDRIARSTIHGAQLIDSLLERGIKVHILNMGVMDNTPTGRLIRNIFFAFAEFERDMIVERTMEGKAIARQREGYREGRPPANVPEFEKYFEQQQSGLITVAAAAKKLGISRSTWYKLAKKVV